MRQVVVAAVTLGLMAVDLKVAPTQRAWAASAGKSSGAILKVGMGARAAALGEAYGSWGDDVFAMGYNPAGLARVGQAQVGVQHLAWFEQAAAEYVAGALPLEGGQGTLGASLLLFRSGDLSRAFGDSAGDYDAAKSQNAGVFTTSNLVGGVSYAHIQGGLHAGLSGKLVRDVVDDQVVQTVAVDVGVQAQVGSSVRWGVSVLNVGGALGRDSLPSMGRAGISYQGGKRLRVPIEVTIPFDGSRTKVGGGVELRVLGPVVVRVGARTGDPPVPSGGLGISWRRLSVDYAFAWFSDTLRDAHRISLTYRFGTP